MLYGNRCARCHGATGMGDGEAGRALNPSPALLAYTIQMPLAADEYLFWTLAEGGVPFGTEMPAFKDELTSDQSSKVVSYMPGVPTCGRMEIRDGNPRESEMRRLFHILTVCLPTALVTAPAFGQQSPGPGYGPHMWNGGWGWMFFGPVMMIVFMAVAVAVIVLIVRWLAGPSYGHQPPRGSTGKEPIDILKERFAKGEIDKEEFEERRRILGE